MFLIFFMYTYMKCKRSVAGIVLRQTIAGEVRVRGRQVCSIACDGAFAFVFDRAGCARALLRKSLLSLLAVRTTPTI